MKTAVIYTRVSTDDQADRGYSLPEQQARLEKYCTIKGIQILNHFQDDHSAKTFNRPGFDQLFKYCKSNKRDIDYLLFLNWYRFSRNTSEAYRNIDLLNHMGIEPQAVEQPLDISIPENKLMLAFYLAAPEVENDRRSLNVISGMRRAQKQGRFLGIAPIGYKNERDEDNRPILVLTEKATLVKKVFQEVSQGIRDREAIRAEYYAKGLDIKKSQFYRLLENPVYMGKVFVKAYKSEPEELVPSIHDSIIDEALFWQVQELIGGLKIDRNRPSVHKKLRDALPLRGFLKCPQCGRHLTGSRSKGNGGYYTYYHCQKKLGCSERQKAEEVNHAFEDILFSLQIKPEVKELYQLILKDSLAKSRKSNKQRLKKLNAAIIKQEERVTRLQDMLADGALEPKEFGTMKGRYQKELLKLKAEKRTLSESERGFESELSFGFNLLENLPELYATATTQNKQKIVGSIFSGTFVYEKDEYRTIELNEVVKLISLKTNGLENKKPEFQADLLEDSGLVVRRGIEPLFSG